MEELLRALRDGGVAMDPAGLEPLGLPALQPLLLDLASRPLTPYEGKFAPRERSAFGWVGPVPVPDLALWALLSNDESAFARLSDVAARSWIKRLLDGAPTIDERLGDPLMVFVSGDARLLPEERPRLLERIKQSAAFESIRFVALARLAVGGTPEALNALRSETSRLLQRLDGPTDEAATLLSYYFWALGSAEPAALQDELEKALRQARTDDVRVLLVFSMGRLALAGSDDGRARARQLILEASSHSPYLGNPDIEKLLHVLHLEKDRG
jgi:hypothetical protein